MEQVDFSGGPRVAHGFRCGQGWPDSEKKQNPCRTEDHMLSRWPNRCRELRQWKHMFIIILLLLPQNVGAYIH
jgi:hypothetical protein